MSRFPGATIIAMSMVAIHVSAGILWAQQDGKPADSEEGWLTWAIAAGLAVVICITGLINAKRSHLT